MRITENYFTKKAGKALGNVETVEPYASGMEYIEDELKLLDLKLILHLQMGIETGTLYPSTQGLISAEEVLTLLDGYDKFGSDRAELEKQIQLMERQIAQRLNMGRERGIHYSLQRLTDLYGLGPFEKFCIIACLATEVNPKYQRIYGYMQNDIYQHKPTIDLQARIYPLKDYEKYLIRSIFDIQAPLTRYIMEQKEELTDCCIPMITRHLKLDDLVVNYLFDIKVLDAQLAKVAEFHQPGVSLKEDKLYYPEDNMEMPLSDRVSKVIEYYRNTGRDKLNKVFYFYGPKGVGKSQQVTNICSRLGLPLIIVDMERMLLSNSYEDFIRRVERQAILSNAALCLKNTDLLLNDTSLQGKLEKLLEIIQSSVSLT